MDFKFYRDSVRFILVLFCLAAVGNPFDCLTVYCLVFALYSAHFMSSAYCIECLLCPVFVLSSVCFILSICGLLLCIRFVLSGVYVYRLLCLVSVCLGFVWQCFFCLKGQLLGHTAMLAARQERGERGK